MIASGSSVRGLSLVTMTKSAFWPAMRPIFGRLPRSRSPPQPKRNTSRAGANSRTVVRMLSMASGVTA